VTRSRTPTSTAPPSASLSTSDQAQARAADLDPQPGRRPSGGSISVTTLDRYSAPQWLGERAVRRFHVMAKPAGSACNLDCTYCFYLSKQALPDGPGGGHMHDDLLER